MSARTTFIIALFTAACSQPLAPGAEPDNATAAIPVGSVTRLAEMSSKQEVVALLHSEGCYHDWKAELRFTRHAEGIQVSGKVPHRTGNKVIGPRLLSEPELVALDEELNAIRMVPNGGFCTTTTTYDFTWHDDKGVARTEHIEDSTCALAQQYYFGPNSTRGYPALTFTALAGEGL